jgi:hypothetical protein
MKKPDFFLVGAAKAGTTSIFKYLLQHPSIFIPDIKEPHYFSEFPQPRAPRLENDEAYLALFEHCPEEATAGDASTSYLYSPNAARRIHDLNPKARILIVLRNPIDRAYSFYWHNRREFAEDQSFEHALDAEPRRVMEGTPFRYHYVTSGLYFEQVKRYLDVFGADAVLIHLFEDLKRDPAGLCQRIFQFLGVDPHYPVDTGSIYNPGGENRNRMVGWLVSPQFPGRKLIRSVFPRASRSAKHWLMAKNITSPKPMNPDTRARLASAFRSDIERLEDLISRDLTTWKAHAGFLQHQSWNHARS